LWVGHCGERTTRPSPCRRWEGGREGIIERTQRIDGSSRSRVAIGIGTYGRFKRKEESGRQASSDDRSDHRNEREGHLRLLTKRGLGYRSSYTLELRHRAYPWDE